jgi:hypothetical protein
MQPVEAQVQPRFAVTTTRAQRPPLHYWDRTELRINYSTGYCISRHRTAQHRSCVPIV